MNTQWILHEEEVNGDQMKVDFPGTEAWASLVTSSIYIDTTQL